MSVSVIQCQICTLSKFKYCCPKCNILYCSVDCYRSVKHQKCSEEFYQKCVKDEMNLHKNNGNHNDAVQMHQILQKFQTNEDLSDHTEENDSDDDDEVLDIGVRLDGVNINDSDKVWSLLTNDEKAEFQSLLDTGEITKLMPSFEPWWNTKIKPNLIEEISTSKCIKSPIISHPKILETIQPFQNLCPNLLPSPCLWFNICNILGAYTNIVEFFQGEHQNSPIDATNLLLGLSATLKNQTNFNSNEQALKSIINEGQACNLGLYISDYETINNNVQNILNGSNNKDYVLAAFSDIYNLLIQAKTLKFSKKVHKESTEQLNTKFPDISTEILYELPKSKFNQLIKKIEYLLSFVNKE